MRSSCRARLSSSSRGAGGRSREEGQGRIELAPKATRSALTEPRQRTTSQRPKNFCLTPIDKDRYVIRITEPGGDYVAEGTDPPIGGVFRPNADGISKLGDRRCMLLP